MPQLLWFSLVLGTALYITGSIIDPDLWWHIVVGRWIVSHAEIPFVDYWTMFGSGELWRAYSWSSEIVLSLVDDRFGIHGLLVLKIILAFSLAASLSYCLSKVAADFFLGTLLGLYATVSCFNHFTLRPQVLVWIFFCYLLFLCVRIEREGLSTRLKFLLALTMCLWANTHISTILGIGAVFLWCFDRAHPQRACLAALYALVGTLITPYLGGEWVTFLQTSTHPFAHASVLEFQPATITQYSTGFLVLLVALLASFFHLRPTSFKISHLVLVGVFLIGAAAVVKFIPFACIVITMVIARFLYEQKQQGLPLTSLEVALEKLRGFYRWCPAAGLTFFVLCAVAVKLNVLWQTPLNQQIVPVRALDFITSNQLPHPILNTFGSGGYLMYRLADQDGKVDYKVAIDGRTNLISQSLWKKFTAALNGTNGWHDFIDLVKPETIFWRRESPLTSLLKAGKEWCLVFQSGSEERGDVVFVKRPYFESRRDLLRSENCS